MILFTYGTLKRGFCNHELLGSSKYLGTARTAPKFTMLHMGGFPGVVAEGETSIAGELYDVDGKTLKELDYLESHPSFYRRQPIKVQGDNGEIEVQAYLLPKDWLDRESRVVDDGEWRNR